MSLDSNFFPNSGRIGEYPFGQLFGRSDVNLAASSSVIEGIPDEQRTSPVRRTFLLVMLFDLLLSFILWIIYVQVASSGNVTDALRLEVVHYTFRTSLFDTVILALARFLVIEIAYGPFVSCTPWWSAGITGITCTVLVAKCFLFNFHQYDSNATGLVYALIISALILTWIETSFLIYRVIPQEKAATRVTTCLTFDGDPNETQSLLGSLRASRFPVYSTYTASVGGYYTPAGSLYGSDIGRVAIKPGSTREAAVDVAALLHRASLLRSEVWYLYGLQAWGADPPWDEASVRSATLQEYDHKVFRLQTTLDASADAVFHDLVYNVDQLSTWNKTIDFIEPLQSLPSENIDIVHNVTHEALNGIISRRDFVLLRHWGEFDERLFLGITSVEHPKCPPLKTCVRAQQLISAFVLEPIPEKSNGCKLVWIMCLDMKISLPQRLVDKAMTGELTNLLNSLRDHARILPAAGSPRMIPLHTMLSTPPTKQSRRKRRLRRTRTTTSSASGESSSRDDEHDAHSAPIT